MLIYLFATVLTLIICVFTYPKEKEVYELSAIKRRKKMVVSCILSTLPLFFVMAVRWNVGVDTWYTYTPEYLVMKSETVPLTSEEEAIIQNSYKLSRRLVENKPKEKLEETPIEKQYEFYSYSYHHTGISFQLLERGLIFLDADVQWLYCLTASIIMGFIFASIWMQSGKPVLACLFFVITGNFFLSMNIVSQFIAIAICLFSCYFAENKKPVVFFLLVALAATFHKSALVFIPVYFLPKLKIKPIWCIITLGMALILAQFCFPILKTIVERIAPVYARHFSKSSDFEWIFFGIGCAVLAIGSYYYPKGKDLPYYKLWYYANVLGLIALCFSGNIPLMKRINYYFAAPHLLFVPMIMGLEENKTKRNVLSAVTIGLFTIQIVVAIGIMNKHGTLPYTAFFQGDRVENLKQLLDHIPGLW